jgi:hypothetical protein
MGLIAKELGRATISATAVGSATTIATNAASSDTIVTQVYLYNQHATDTIKCSVLYTPDSTGSVGTPAAADVLFTVSLAALEGVAIPVNIAMTDTNDTLKAYASTASQILAHAHGVTFPDLS